MKIEVEAAVGSVVECDGALWLVESIETHTSMVLQKIEPMIERIAAGEEFTHSPMFQRLHGLPEVFEPLTVLKRPESPYNAAR